MGWGGVKLNWVGVGVVVAVGEGVGEGVGDVESVWVRAWERVRAWVCGAGMSGMRME